MIYYKNEAYYSTMRSVLHTVGNRDAQYTMSTTQSNNSTRLNVAKHVQFNSNIYTYKVVR